MGSIPSAAPLTPNRRLASVPSFDDINSIPVDKVIKKLPVERVGKDKLRCWHPERHEVGDRTASVGIDRKRNGVTCFGCPNVREMSNLDLVMDVLALDLRGAAAWFDAHFVVERLPKGKHLARTALRGPARAGIGEVMEDLFRSGLLAKFSLAEQSVLSLLLAFSDATVDGLTIAYGTIRGHCGIGNDLTVSRALRRFERLRFLKIERGRDDRLRAVNRYRLDYDRLRQLATECYERERDEREAQIALRADARNAARRRVAKKSAASASQSARVIEFSRE